MSKTVSEPHPINNPSVEPEFTPVTLHRVRTDLQELSARFGIPVKALCGFEFEVQARQSGLSSTTAGLELMCPSCETLYSLLSR
jgi:hypothetical protein